MSSATPRPHACVVLAIDPGATSGWAIPHQCVLLHNVRVSDVTLIESGVARTAAERAYAVSRVVEASRIYGVPIAVVAEKWSSHGAFGGARTQRGLGAAWGAWREQLELAGIPKRRVIRVLAGPAPDGGTYATVAITFYETHEDFMAGRGKPLTATNGPPVTLTRDDIERVATEVAAAHGMSLYSIERDTDGGGDDEGGWFVRIDNDEARALAYIECDESAPNATSELRRACAARIPDDSVGGTTALVRIEPPRGCDSCGNVMLRSERYRCGFCGHVHAMVRT